MNAPRKISGTLVDPQAILRELPGALWIPRGVRVEGRGRLKREGIYIIRIHIFVQQKPAGTSRQYDQVSIAAARKPEKKELKVKNGVERAEMLFRQVGDFIE